MLGRIRRAFELHGVIGGLRIGASRFRSLFWLASPSRRRALAYAQEADVGSRHLRKFRPCRG
jgi:hypothetical protein